MKRFLYQQDELAEKFLVGTATLPFEKLPFLARLLRIAFSLPSAKKLRLTVPNHKPLFPFKAIKLLVENSFGLTRNSLRAFPGLLSGPFRSNPDLS